MSRTLNISKFILITALLLFGRTGIAQDAVDRFFGDLREDPEVTSVIVSSKMFGLFADISSESEESAAASEVLRQLTGIKMLTKSDVSGAGLYQKYARKLDKHYDVLMTVDQADEKVGFYITEVQGRVTEFVMLVGERSSFFVMSISGDIDLEKLSSLSKSMNVGGMNYLEKLGNENVE